MNLSKRTVFVIVPVLFLSYFLAGIFAYFPFKHTIESLEQNRLDLAATELAASFNKYSTYAESYLFTLSADKMLRNFISKGSSNEHKVLLSSAIEKTIRKLEYHQSNKISVLITKKDKASINVLYFFEFSDDPFASVSQIMTDAYQAAHASNTIKSWHYGEKNNNTSIIVGHLLDQTTFSQPIANKTDNSVLIQFIIEPSEFITRKKQLQNKFNAEIYLKLSDQERIELAQKRSFISTENVGPQGKLTIALPINFLTDKLYLTQLIFISISLCLFVLSTFLLYQLVRKYITQPISNLESELGEVLHHEKENITIKHDKNDEVGRLERTFHQLYGKLSQSYLKTKELAEHDTLTNLYNLSVVNTKTQQALINAQKNDLCVSFMYIDLDNFKFVNDKYGHDVGDALLQTFAIRLTKVLISTDIHCPPNQFETTIGRIAGDEFSVIVTHPKGSLIPKKIAQRILNIFQHGFNFELGKFPVSASIGISIFPEDGRTLSQLVSNADSAMYQSKNNGKNKISFYSKDLAMAARRKMEIEQELKTLNPDKEFFLVYMALVNANSKKIEGFEVLLRWKSSKLGFVGPDEFVPIAETCGLFNKIDAWVTENAIASYHRLRDKLGYDYKLSINLSSAQLNLNLIGDSLVELVKRYNVQPELIQLEITETINVEYTNKANTLLNILCDLGFQIAIDDFGTGYTALLQLIEYPAKMIKFDKTFVEKAMLPTNRMMLSPLVSLCHSQGLKVTVEGVETEEMADYLSSIGCDMLQGFFYGKPVPLGELVLPECYKKISTQ